MDYLSHSNRSKTSVEAMRAAEEALDAFWTNLRYHQDIRVSLSSISKQYMLVFS